MKKTIKYFLVLLLIAFGLQSCVSKKEVLYLQDSQRLNQTEVKYGTNKLQPNDILKITVESPLAEAALPYNKMPVAGIQGNSIELLKLEGYLVSPQYIISFPVLGEVSVKDQTPQELETYLEKQLEEGGHLSTPKVNARLLNAKVTILGEVNQPGTYTFTENNITVLQALGLAGDLTINGQREDVLLVREQQGVRTVTHLDLTQSDWMEGDFYMIKPNDVLLVNPNSAKVKSAGFIGNAGTVLTIVSIVLSTAILLTR